MGSNISHLPSDIKPDTMNASPVHHRATQSQTTEVTPTHDLGPSFKLTGFGLSGRSGYRLGLLMWKNTHEPVNKTKILRLTNIIFSYFLIFTSDNGMGNKQD